MDQTPSFDSLSLTLRPFQEDDLEALTAILNHPDLTGLRYLPWGFPKNEPLSKEQVKKALAKWGEKEEGYVLAITLQKDGTLVGYTEADWRWDPHCPGINLVVAPPYQRQGYGGEALQVVLTYLFQNSPAHNISMYTPEWNEAGRAFAAKHGFTEVGAERRVGIRGGKFYDEVSVDILRPEWLAAQGGA